MEHLGLLDCPGCHGAGCYLCVPDPDADADERAREYRDEQLAERRERDQDRQPGDRYRPY